MAMNKFMHPRNIYKSPPNFIELCRCYPELEQYIEHKQKGKSMLNFENPDGLRCFTKILLTRDFGLNITIPKDTLIPTLPLRLNYVLWLEDLLEWNAVEDTPIPIKGIDIGTGATCIFPLLAAKKNGWKMFATEVNEDNATMALENVKKNSLEHLVSVVRVLNSSILLDGVVEKKENLDFCMCNPPFFNSDEFEIKKKDRTNRRKKAKNSKSGKVEEMLSPGGEVEFVKRLIQDSLILLEKIKIYTTMIGHKSSLQPLIHELKKSGIKSYCQTEFCQGRTIRWAIAWTFTNIILKRISPLSEYKSLRPVNLMLESSGLTFAKYLEILLQLLSQLKIDFSFVEDFKYKKTFRITAYENTWTGLRRKKREKIRSEKLTSNLKNLTMPDMYESSENDDIRAYTDVVKEENLNFTYCNSTSSEKRKMSTGEDNLNFVKFSNDNTHSCNNEKFDNRKIPLLVAVLSLKSFNNKKIQIQILYERGQKDAPQQILQFLKNNFILSS